MVTTVLTGAPDERSSVVDTNAGEDDEQ